ncbi:phage tail tape measure protein [Virgibacillus profundi]|uniref:Phage tail tape measure protein n=1 Tax=Virgibacillus profundi TaxID=2024555 RepID=A0A2A2ICE9_9BACI|nr:phage tail tape measure protein [Virgibacillus profundi]PAV29252.1 phage tail tape measure protein [Virgibacillus profundi]PXY53421.1 phage tail tape measure protein [Virgibacillus profundi]
MADVGEIRAKLTLKNDEFKRKMDESRKQMEKTGFSAKQMGEDFDAVQKGSAVMGAAIVAGLGASVKVSADFESSMKRVQAVSNASEEDMKRLEAAAREAGSTTVFSASESAAALQYMAMAGFDVEQQITALPAILNTAAAAQIDLGTSSDIVTNIMSGFGIAAEDVEGAVDVLVKTSNTANTDIPKLGEAMKIIGPVASSLGLSLESTSAAIGELGNVGISSSSAGTALRAMLLSLANPTGQTTKAMEELNIEINDSEGNMKPLPELMGHVSDKMDGMTDAQKTQAAAQLVGTEATSGFLALLNVGEEGLQDYTTELENSAGTAERVADIQNDSLIGSFKEFQSVVEEAGIKLGNEFLPLFTDIVEKGTDVVKAISEVDASTLKAGVTFVGTASGIALAASTIGKLVLSFRGLMLALGPAGWAIVGVSALTGLVAGLNVKMAANREVNLENADALMDQADSLEANVERFEELETKSRLTKDEFGKLLDIQKRLENETDPEKIKDLEKAYEELAGKSGLSKKEINELIEANDNIIEQAPQVEKTFSEKGNAIVDSTDAVHDYINALHDMALIELEAERVIALENEAKARQDIADAQKDLARLEDEINFAIENRSLTTEEIDARVKEINNKFSEGILTSEEQWDLDRERATLLSIQRGTISDTLDDLRNQVEEARNKKELGEEELEQLNIVNERIAEVLLKQGGLTYEKGQGLEIIKEEAERLVEEKRQLEENYGAAHKNTEEYRQAKQAIEDKIESLGGVYSEIEDITGNTEVFNSELGREIEKLFSVHGYDLGDARDLNRELARSVHKQISLSYNRTGAGAVRNHGLLRHQGGLVGVESLQDKMPKLHNGGLASQLENMPMHNEIDVRLLRNEMVLTEGQQANLMRMIDMGQSSSNNSNLDKNDRVAALLSELISITREGSHTEISMDGRLVGALVEPHVSEKQARNLHRAMRMPR